MQAQSGLRSYSLSASGFGSKSMLSISSSVVLPLPSVASVSELLSVSDPPFSETFIVLLAGSVDALSVSELGELKTITIMHIARVAMATAIPRLAVDED